MRQRPNITQFTFNRDIAARFRDIAPLARMGGVFTGNTVNADGTWTLLGTGEFKLPAYATVEIDGTPGYFHVVSTAEDSITLKGPAPVLNEGIFYVSQAFLAGHEVEVANIEEAARRMAGKERPIYPLVWLALNTVRIYDPNRKDGGAVEFEGDVTVFLVHRSTINARAQERFDTVFQDVLYPLAERWVNAMARSGFFTHAGLPPFFTWEAEEMPRFGSEKNNANTFNTVTDALRLSFRGLKFAKERTICAPGWAGPFPSTPSPLVPGGVGGVITTPTRIAYTISNIVYEFAIRPTDGAAVYSVNGVEQFALMPDGTVLGQVLTEIPAEINNLQSGTQAHDSRLVVRDSGGFAFEVDGAEVFAVGPDGTLTASLPIPAQIENGLGGVWGIDADGAFLDMGGGELFRISATGAVTGQVLTQVPSYITRDVGGLEARVELFSDGAFRYLFNGVLLFGVDATGAVFGNVLTEVPDFITRDIGGLEARVQLGADGRFSYVFDGIERFGVAPDGTVFGDVLTEVPDFITDNGAPENILQVTPSGLAFKSGGSNVFTVTPGGVWNPEPWASARSYKHPLFVWSPDNQAFGAMTFPAIPPLTEVTARVTLATGGFRAGGFVLVYPGAGAGVNSFLANGWLGWSNFQSWGQWTTDQLVPLLNAAGVFGGWTQQGHLAIKTAYAAANYLDSRRFNASTTREFNSATGTTLFPGWTQRYHSADRLFGYNSSAESGLFGLNAKIELRRLYVEPSIVPGSTDVVFVMYNNSLTVTNTSRVDTVLLVY